MILSCGTTSKTSIEVAGSFWRLCEVRTRLGKEVFAPYCLIAKIRDGKIFRGEEYFDTFQLGSRPAPGSTEMISAGADRSK